MRSMIAFLTVGLIVAGLGIPPVLAASQHTGHDSHVQQTQTKVLQTLPLEGGQSAFAAIAEIVAMLKNDPDTDWQMVDIDALREHLVDMNELSLNAKVQTASNDREIVFHITGQGRTLQAIQAMVPAHTAVLTAENFYTVEATLVEDGARMKFVFSSPQEQQEIYALGFFGIMAIGAHHQQHHLDMATGHGHGH